MFRWTLRPQSRYLAVVGLLLGLVTQLWALPIFATNGFQQSYLRLDRLKINTATGGTVCAQPATVGTEAKVVLTFPATYTVNTTAANWTTSVTNLPAGSTAWPSIGATATSATSPANVVTFASGDLTVATMYCFNITDDQIVVSAVVPPSFSFSLSGNNDAFTTNLDPASVISTTGKTVTITTNAKGGWIAWAKDSNQGLSSATTSYTIPTAGTVNGAPSTLSSGTEGYVLDTDLTTDAAGGCTLAIDAEYNGSGSNQGGTLSANFQPIAACTGASPATANGDVITLIERAAIAGATPAGTDYTDIITVVGAGNF
jgi:hypothetical protein